MRRVLALAGVFALSVPFAADAQSGAPTITSASSFTVDEGSTAVASLAATDPEGDSLTWSIADPGGDDGDLFTLSGAGALAFAEAPDYENPADSDRDRVHEVTVEVSDGSNSATADLQVTVRNVVPGLAGPATASHPEGKRGLRIASYTATDGDAWTLAGDDAAKFTIAGGFLRFINPPDFENASDGNADNVYDVAVSAGDGTTTEAVSVAVTVTNVEEPGVVTLSPLRPELGVALTASLIDPDNVSGTPSWQWERSLGRDGWETIAAATAASYTPTAADTERHLRATATYADSLGAGRSAQATASHVVIAHRLSALRFTGLTGVSGDSRAFYPAFDRDTLHYAARCTESVTLTVGVEDAGVRLSVDGVQRSAGRALTVSGLGGESDIRINLSDGLGASTTYTVHCIDRVEFPKLTTVKAAGAMEELAVFKTKLRPRGEWWRGHLIMMDNNGVPRFRRRISDNIYTYFRAFSDGTHPGARYGYLKFGDSFNPDGVELVVLDRYFNVVDEDIHILNPFRNTDPHDFRVLPNGDYLLMAYHPTRHDLSIVNTEFPDVHGGSLGSNETVRDSAIQIRTAGGAATLNWNSWDHMAIEDCIRGSAFGSEYAHVNSLAWFDGDVIAGFRHCSKILRIDGDTGDIVWRAGPSIRSRAEWEAGQTLQPNRGPAPLDFVNDPAGGFSGQHGGVITGSGNLLVYDNSTHCDPVAGAPADARTDSGGQCGEATRAAEYAIDTANGELVFQREYRLGGPNDGGPGGHAEPLPNGDWVVSWSNAPPHENSAVHVDAETGVRKLGLTVRHIAGREIGAIDTTRVTAISPVALAAPVDPLEASIVDWPEFHSGAADRPTVIVAFNQPVVDVAAASSSVSVTGATATVAPHIAVDVPANAYAFALTPSGDGDVRFALTANLPCSSDGICTAAGGALSAVPDEIVIPGPVEVAFGAAAYQGAEGGGASLLVVLNRAHGRTGALTIPIEVQGGAATPGVDFSVPSSVGFGSTEIAATVTVTVPIDNLVEGDEAFTLAFPATLPGGVIAGAPTVATVTVADATDDRITLAGGLTEVAEGEFLDLWFRAGADITFTTPQTIGIEVSGAAQTADYTVSAAGATLTVPYEVTLPAGANRVVATIGIVDDSAQESAETLTVTARRGGTAVGTHTVRIPASDTNLPRVTVEAPAAGGLAEGASLTFTLRRSGAATEQLAVSLEVTETGDMLGAGLPATASFAAGSPTATITVATVADSVVEDASEITVRVLASGTSSYEVGAPQTVTATVADDDRVALALTVAPPQIAEGDTALASISITNGATFSLDRTIALTFGGEAQARDYRVTSGGALLSSPWRLTLAAGSTSVSAQITAVDDEEEEQAETITVAASHDSMSLGSSTLTIRASDSPPQVRVAAVTAEVVEGGAVEFSVTRFNPTEPTDLPQTTVPLRIAAPGSRLEDTPPTEVTFASGSTAETLRLNTKDDTIAEAAAAVTVTLTPAAGSPPAYRISGPGTATVTIADNDLPRFAVSVAPTVVAEGGESLVAVSITNGVTFSESQTLTLFPTGGRGTASYGADYAAYASNGSERETLRLRRGFDSAAATIRIADDTRSEGAETIRLMAAYAGQPIGAPVTITIAASDGHPDTLLPPELDMATIDGAALVLLYTKPLDDASQPAAGDFSVRVGGTARTVASAQVTGPEVRLTLSSAASHGERVEVDYAPGVSPLRDLDGNAVPAASGVTAVETLVDVIGGRAPEGEPVVFRVLLSRAVETALGLDWSLSDGTARSGSDYEESQSGTVSVAVNATEAAIEVRTIDDASGESDETFTLMVSEPANFPFWARLRSVEATGTIENDDAAPPPSPPPPPPPPPPPSPPPPPPSPPPPSPDPDPSLLSARFDLDADCSDDPCVVRTGVEVAFRDLSTGTVSRRSWDFGDGFTSSSPRPRHAWSSPGFYRVELVVSGLGATSKASRDILVRASEPAGACEPDAETLCLQDSRFSVVVKWRTGDGRSGAASVVHAGSNDSGLFWFFNRENWEVLIKVLDGCAVNGYVWVYGASTTDVGYRIVVTDTVAGAVREYRNEPGEVAPAIVDSTAFAEACASGVPVDAAAH